MKASSTFPNVLIASIRSVLRRHGCGAPTNSYTYGVKGDARQALNTIRRCIDDDRYLIAVHFAERMQERGLFWPDVEAVFYDPHEVRSQGMDRFDRPKWIIRGEAGNGDEVEIVCAIELDETETEFITLYWED